MKQYITILFFILFASTSCKKFLETPALNNVSVDDVFRDFQGARLTLIGMYDLLRNTNYYLRDIYLYADVAGGNVKYSRTAGQQLFQTYNFENEAANTDMKGFYDNAYKVIYGANNLFKYINEAKDATEQQRNRLLADAFVFRAFAHFDLVKTFAQPYNFTSGGNHKGIVLRLQNTDVVLPIEQASTVNQVYSAIVTDLDSAINRFANSTNIYPGLAAKQSFSADFAKALKARVLLYKEDFAATISLCNELIVANNYPLISNTSYLNSWRNRNNFSESIFELSFENINGTGIGNYFNPFVANSQFLQYAATNDLLNLYAANDVRNASSFYSSATINSVPFLFCKKYQGTADSINNIKILRSSELYLSRAEAFAKTGNLTAALADLNTIRRRANPTAALFSSAIQADVVNEILTERRRELCFEGHLLYDIARNKQNLVRTDCNARVCGFTYPDARFASPIPTIF